MVWWDLRLESLNDMVLKKILMFWFCHLFILYLLWENKVSRRSKNLFCCFAFRSFGWGTLDQVRKYFRERESVLLKFTSGQVTYDENSFLTPLVWVHNYDCCTLNAFFFWGSLQHMLDQFFILSCLKNSLCCPTISVRCIWKLLPLLSDNGKCQIFGLRNYM